MLGVGLNLGPARSGRLAWWMSAPYLLAGAPPSLAADFVRGRFALDGVAKSASDILAVSSGAKWVADASGALAQVPANSPAFGYAAGRRQLVVEGAGNNYITNNTMQGAAGGSPGARPSGWGLAVPAGLSYEITGVGAIGNRDYVDARFYGTATTTGEAGLDPLNPAVVTAAAGQTWTHSAWCDVIAGAPPNSPQLALFERTSAGAYLAGDRQNIGPFSTRTQVTRTLTNGSTAFVQPACRVTVPAGTTCDFTLRIAAPQLEQAGIATSLIKTSGSQASRIADVVSLTAAALAALGTPGAAAWRGLASPADTSRNLWTGGGTKLVFGVSNANSLLMHAAPSLVIAGLGTATAIGCCGAWAAGGTKGSNLGGAVASDAVDAAFSFSGSYIGGLGGPGSGTAYAIDEIVAWALPGLAADAAVQAQARSWQ